MTDAPYVSSTIPEPSSSTITDSDASPTLIPETFELVISETETLGLLVDWSQTGYHDREPRRYLMVSGVQEKALRRVRAAVRKFDRIVEIGGVTPESLDNGHNFAHSRAHDACRARPLTLTFTRPRAARADATAPAAPASGLASGTSGSAPGSTAAAEDGATATPEPEDAPPPGVAPPGAAAAPRVKTEEGLDAEDGADDAAAAAPPAEPSSAAAQTGDPAPRSTGGAAELGVGSLVGARFEKNFRGYGMYKGHVASAVVDASNSGKKRYVVEWEFAGDEPYEDVHTEKDVLAWVRADKRALATSGGPSTSFPSLDPPAPPPPPPTTTTTTAEPRVEQEEPAGVAAAPTAAAADVEMTDGAPDERDAVEATADGPVAEHSLGQTSATDATAADDPVAEAAASAADAAAADGPVAEAAAEVIEAPAEPVDAPTAGPDARGLLGARFEKNFTGYGLYKGVVASGPDAKGKYEVVWDPAVDYEDRYAAKVVEGWINADRKKRASAEKRARSEAASEEAVKRAKQNP